MGQGSASSSGSAGWATGGEVFLRRPAARRDALRSTGQKAAEASPSCWWCRSEARVLGPGGGGAVEEAVEEAFSLSVRGRLAGLLVGSWLLGMSLPRSLILACVREAGGRSADPFSVRWDARLFGPRGRCGPRRAL